MTEKVHVPGFGTLFKYRRSPYWQIRYFHRGKPRQESSHSTKQQAATNLLKKRVTEMTSGRLIGPAADKVTLAGLEAMLVANYEVKARKSKPPLARLRDYFGEHAHALDITPDRVTADVQKRLKERAAAQTVKNEVTALGRMFTLAYRAGRLPHRPFFEMPRVSNARQGFFTDAEVGRLLEHLPPYLRPFVEAAYITGWRRGELRNLRWSQVEWETGTMRLERGTTKSGEPRVFPFGEFPHLHTILRQQQEATLALERETDGIVPWVFHRDGQQVAWHYHAWRVACAKAGIPGRLLHDMRRSAVRNLVRAGVSEPVAMTLSGHKTRAIFDRYNIVADADLREAVRRLAAYHGTEAPEPRKVVALGGARTRRQ